MAVTARVVDVRDDIRRGDEPFDRIVAAVASLAAGEEFEPVPSTACAQQGVAHETTRTPGAAGGWRSGAHESNGLVPAVVRAVTGMYRFVAIAELLGAAAGHVPGRCCGGRGCGPIVSPSRHR
jgi:hypothetical protein